MSDLDNALDDLDAEDLRALKRAAWEKALTSTDAPRIGVVWSALAVAAAEAEDRRASTLRAMADDLAGTARQVEE